MTDSAFRGPISNMGAMEDSPSTVDVEDGPIYSYQGYVVSDVRTTPFNKDGVGPGRVPAYMLSNDFIVVDNIPSTATTTVLAAASTTLAATGLTLVTVAPGTSTAGTPSIATGVPLVPFGATAAVTAAIALDFGFTTGTTTAASSTVPVNTTTLFTVGQWIGIGGAGNSAKTLTLLTQVTAVNSTTINISPVAAGTLVGAPIGRANLWNNLTPPSVQFGPTAAAPTGVAVQQAAGLFRLFDPLSAIARNVCVQATTTAGAGGAFVVNGWDIYGQAMTETINVAAATTTGSYGKKAFKYIKSVVPGFTDTAGSYSVGVGDTFGVNVFARRVESMYWSFGGVTQTGSTGFTVPDTTNPATSSTGDVRGTVQFGALGASASFVGSTNTGSNGVRRLYMVASPPLNDIIATTPNNTSTFFGVTQQ